MFGFLFPNDHYSSKKNLFFVGCSRTICERFGCRFRVLMGNMIICYFIYVLCIGIVAYVFAPSLGAYFWPSLHGCL